MSSIPDFEFGFGAGRHLKGRGWRGLFALALLLSALVASLWISGPQAARFAVSIWRSGLLVADGRFTPGD